MSGHGHGHGHDYDYDYDYDTLRCPARGGNFALEYGPRLWAPAASLLLPRDWGAILGRFWPREMKRPGPRQICAYQVFCGGRNTGVNSPA